MRKFIPWISIAGIIMMISANIAAALSGGFNLPLFLLGGTGLLFFLSISFIAETAAFSNYIKFSMNIFFLLGIIYFLFLIVSAHNVQWDMTKNKKYSLSIQSKQYLSSLDENIIVTGFSTTPQKMQIFFKPYTSRTDKIKVRVHNPFMDFREAQILEEKFGTNLSPGDVFIQCGKKKKIIKELNENTFINSLIQVQQKNDIVIYFMQGHGEGSFNKPTEKQLENKIPSFYALKRICEERGMKVKPLELLRTGLIPGDASAIVCTGPKQDLFTLEMDLLEPWLDNGGKFMLLLDPETGHNHSYPNFSSLMHRYGIKFKNDIVMDPNKASMKKFHLPVVPLVSEYCKHPICSGIPENKTSLFLPMARTVNKTTPLPRGVTFTPLLKSSSFSWSQSIKDVLKKDISPPEKKDIFPQNLAAAVTYTPHTLNENIETRMVIFGDSDVFTDINIVYQIPVYLFLNSISWLTSRDNIIAIPPVILEDTPLELTAAMKELLAVLLIITIPSLILIGGLGYTVIRRRVR
jgi:gliding motility-associatede transport system auxiliary component